MPKRTDIHRILIIGSGPIVIGQACEFDYSGTQACKALRAEGYEVVLVNSNPATIMTDPQFADVTYIEPLTTEVIDLILAKEKPDALLPTLGGQTALNLTMKLHEKGILAKHGVKLIGAQIEAIRKGEDRELFKQAMMKIGLDCAKSALAQTIEQARAAMQLIGTFPLIIRPAFTLGGTGGGVAYNREEFEEIVARGLEASPVKQILVEEYLAGWKEYEMEVMRDRKDQCVIVCAIENFDPMGVHTGDSITVAPTMTLTDKEYQRMRDASFACIREVGVETGGSNIQFALNPENGRMVIIEMNPRVSRSSALASKATGFPIAKLAALLAVGYTLDELPNDITQSTRASFEPSIDYVVVKIPRFTFEKFPEADNTLTSSMKSVGEAMAIGRTFKEAFQKALRSLEIGARGLGGGGRFGGREHTDLAEIRARLVRPTAERVFFLRYALLAGVSLAELHDLTGIDPWFLQQVDEIVRCEQALAAAGHALPDALLRQAREMGFTDTQISHLTGLDKGLVHRRRGEIGVGTVYRLVDTCAAEFEARTPYYYSTAGAENEASPTPGKRKVMIIGGGPNRIGQGIEFDYCCVHASFALRELGIESVMVNSNPETVSTDYDTSSRLYFEPLTLDDVLEVYRTEGCDGAIVQFGGQTPLNLARQLEAHGVRVIGTSPTSIDRAENRQLFEAVLERLQLQRPVNAIAREPGEAFAAAERIGFPILLRPSFVLGGRGMFICYNRTEMAAVVHQAFDAAPGEPLLIDRFLEDAIEVDVDCLSDGETTVLGGMLEHIEYAGVHSGDAAMVLPPHTLSPKMIQAIRTATHALAKELHVVGLMNVQFAIKREGGPLPREELYVLEVNPRASRTVPFVSKAIGVPLAKLATQVMTGAKLKDLGFTEEIWMPFYAVKESVFPFMRFPGAPIALTPEMRSTGEVMGIDDDLGLAYAKAQMAAFSALPRSGGVFLSVKDSDKPLAVDIARRLESFGFKIFSTSGTAQILRDNGVNVTRLQKIAEGRPHVIDKIKNGEIQLVINTPSGMIPRRDENTMRAAALKEGVCMITTITGAKAALLGIASLRQHALSVRPLQQFAKQARTRTSHP